MGEPTNPPLEVRRLGQFLAGELEVWEGHAPEQFTDQPLRADPHGSSLPAASFSWVLRATAFGPHRSSDSQWRHLPCNGVTLALSGERLTLSHDPGFYTTLYCHGCRERFPVAEFVWVRDNTPVGAP